MGLWYVNGSPNLGQKTRFYYNQQKKKRQNYGLCCPRWPQNKTERRISTRTLLGNWKKLWNIKVSIIPIMIGAFGTVTERLEQGLEDFERVDEWRPSKQLHYWEESWRLEETCCYSNSSERPSANTDVKNSQWVNNKNKSVLENEIQCRPDN